MNRRLFGIVVALGFGLLVASAAVIACPEHDGATAEKDKAAATTADSKGGDSKPCSHGTATTVSADPKDGRSETASEVKKGGCSKPCGGDAHAAKTSATAGSKPCCGNGKNCGSRCGKSATASAEGGCPIGKKIDAVMASLPAMKYRVGDEVLDCAKSAAAKSDATGKTIEFVVADSTFKEKGEAAAKLASLLETELENMETIQFVAGGKCMKCPMTAKSVAAESKSEVAYRVGGVDFAKKEDAEKALAAVTKAVADIHMEYKVGEQKYGCDKMAGEKAKENGGKMTYVVGGEETCCSTMAKLLLAEAKVRKVVETAVQTSFQS